VFDILACGATFGDGAERVVPHETILIVEDEKDIAELLAYNLKKEGFRTRIAETGEKGLALVSASPPNLILLDLMLPGVDGREVCRRLKAAETTRSIPIVMLTARGEDTDVVAGLELGADDYITKPFSPKVLVARVRTVLRRLSEPIPELPDRIRLHELDIDVVRHQVSCRGAPVGLSATEFGLLVFLARRPGWVFSRAQIISGVRGEDYPVTERAVDVQVLGLRRKLGPCGEAIETVRGVGYRLKEDTA
jgi:two-component system phosphate regulon response regulator PhoB